jgi:hypothetical protein
LNQIVPPRFLFRWSFVAKEIDSLPHKAGRLLNLPDDCLLPSLAELDQKSDFAEVRLAWNHGGLALSVLVTGRSRRPEPAAGTARPDGIWLWFDTRNTQTVHRATRFCHHFILHPIGLTKKSGPLVKSLPVARAREETPVPNSERVAIQSEMTDTGYWIDAWFPKEVFVGFDPATHAQIGFHYIVHDSELGEQTLAVGSEFPFESDPSLWQTVELRA